MFWIDKQNKRRRREGHRIVNRFLREAWNEQNGMYVNCTYASFKRNREMERLLHNEQGGFCCYCMRYLEVGRHTSLEHVMPHNSVNSQNKTDFKKINYYKRFNKTFKRNVIYKHLNGTRRKWYSCPPYPHFCAYENLVLSCDGSLFIDEDRERKLHPSNIHLCCNEHRGNQLIVPLFFIPDIDNLIVYNENGTIGISQLVKSPLRQIELSDTIDDLALENERLRIIRQAWYHIAKSSYGIEQVKTAVNDKSLRQNIIMDSGIPLNIVNRINHPIYWSLLCEYFWFYNHFIQQT